MTKSETNKRIAKNTLFLYIRMFITMGVSLFTSRVILQTLGVEDFGIYNVVAGIVVLFTFINNAMAIASQRFLSFALGRGDKDEVSKVFSMSLTSHFAIALLVLILAESLGLFVLGKMNFPDLRINAVLWSYQFAVFTCLVRILRVPYNASIIAYEKMSFYAWVSIIEVILNLVIVYLLFIYKGDKLIFYSFLLFVITLIVNLIYKIFCNKKIETSYYHFYWNHKQFKEFISFSGWSLAGSLANVSATQGLNMIINIFCGVTVNAAVGISNQVMGAVGHFLGNFQTAFNPQLVKSYANGDREYFMNLIFKSSKFSYYLMLVIALPTILFCNFLLHVWLGDVPEYATEFSQLMIAYLLLDAISGPLWISVQASGKIKNYQLLMAFLILLNLPITYIILKIGLSPVYAFVARVIINFVTLLARVIYLRPLIQLPARKYIMNVLFPLFLVTVLVIPLPLYLKHILQITLMNVVIVSVISFVSSLLIIYLIGLTNLERKVVRAIVTKRILKR